MADRRIGQGLYPAAKVEKAPLTMFKALSLATWSDLSDAGALAGQASAASRGFPRDEATGAPRLRPLSRLSRAIAASLPRDLESKGTSVRKGTSP